MNRFCPICEKEVRSMFKIIINGIEHFKGDCGHTCRIVEEKKPSSPMFIMRGNGWHNTDYRSK